MDSELIILKMLHSAEAIESRITYTLSLHKTQSDYLLDHITKLARANRPAFIRKPYLDLYLQLNRP